MTSSNSTAVAIPTNSKAPVKKKKNSCKVDKDCADYPYFRCGVHLKGICDHKKVFPPTGLEIGGWIVFAIFKTLSNIAGVGGGGVSTPLAMAFFHLQTK